MTKLTGEVRRADGGFALMLPRAAVEHLGLTSKDVDSKPLDVSIHLNEGSTMTVQRLQPKAGRVHIDHLEAAPQAQIKKAPAGAPFTTRPLVPEDLGTLADKGRDDLVQVRENDGALKMTRTRQAEVRRVRKTVSNDLPMAAFTGPAPQETRKK